ncbi:putative SCP-like extracellular protein [Phytophthora cinnamomi]|uniref:putative SCP-like extracellular protein n=1 Tax=Phytophthora cinnamomi TaxID=4785 RepID=UPI00355948C0|nr:putative SCP-like extracellular protein [Phytophthora cinnamomi]
MKLSNVIAFSTAAVAVVSAESYSEPDQAIWIDRHNFFRTTGLPWSAGNMRRIGWDADLATKAASAAQKCSATTSTGVNAFQSTATNASDAIDQAIQQWVVETAVSTIKTMAQPGSSGLDVGVGVYNSYSQVVWASTTSVGCATATCSGGELVVCEYSPAGNDGESAWYKHASQASECPDNTVAAGSLCVDEGDDANNQIAPIASGDYTYQVYPSFVSDIQSILLNSARDIANGSIPPSTASPSTKESSGTPTKQESESPSSSSASTATQDDSYLSPGKVKPSSETGSTFQNEAKTPAAQESTKTALKSSTTSSEESTKQQTESLTSSTAEKGAASHGMSTLGMVSMFILGVAAVAGIVMFVHYRVSTQRQNDILLDGGIQR